MSGAHPPIKKAGRAKTRATCGIDQPTHLRPDAQRFAHAVPRQALRVQRGRLSIGVDLYRQSDVLFRTGVQPPRFLVRGGESGAKIDEARGIV